MKTTLLVPRQQHPAIEERYAGDQTRLLLSRDPSVVATIEYGADAPLSAALEQVESELVMIATSLLIAPPPRAASRLAAALGENDAAVAVMSSPDNALQQTQPPRAYLTLRQFENVAETITATATPESSVWSGGDPVLYLARRDRLDAAAVARDALTGRRVSIASSCFIHRFASQRGQLRDDLLARVDPSATAVLEFGCGEGALGGAIKARQNARVVGIELDREAAAIAATRLDRVVSGDVRTLIDSIGESFDFIVGGDIVEHLDDPWQFLRELKRVAGPGAKLLLSLPNIANFSIVTDLLAGRFDYVYLGILCAGHLRFFTRSTITDMLEISGWTQLAIEAQPALLTEEFEVLKQKLDAASIHYAADDLLAPGWYVTAVNPSR